MGLLRQVKATEREHFLHEEIPYPRVVGPSSLGLNVPQQQIMANRPVRAVHAVRMFLPHD